nr:MULTISPECIES: hypothetical protein [unclassified Streptomyces]
MGEGVQELGGQPFRQHDQVRTDPCLLGKTCVGVGEQAQHGLRREVAGIPGGEAGSPRGQAFVRQEG